MKNNMIDLLFVLLLVLFFYRAELVKPLRLLNSGGYLSVNTGKYYRGFFAIVVVFHHLAQRTETGIAFRYFTSVGYLAVAFFFFLSGYGLQKSYITKYDRYRKGFILKRIPTILIPYIIITAIYWLMYFIGDKYYSLKDIGIAIVNGSPIVSHSWYIICILAFYVVFWLIMTTCRKHYFLMILCGTVWYFLYAVFCVKMGYGSWWYNASHLLIVGMFWATYEKPILELLYRTYQFFAPFTWFSFVVLFLFHGKIAAIVNLPYISLILTLVTAILFVLSVIMFSLKVQIGNKILEFLGEISLEIYISQGLFMTTLRSGWIYINNELLWCILVLTGTIVFSHCLHKVFQYIFSKYKCLLHNLKI